MRVLENAPRVRSVLVGPGRCLRLVIVRAEGDDAYSLLVHVPVRFPRERPIFTVDDRRFPFLSHVNSGGTVCVGEGGGHNVDLSDPGRTLQWWLAEALRVLDRGAAQSARGELDELIDEFTGYWNALAAYRVALMASPVGEPRILRGHVERGRLRAVNLDGLRPDRHHVAHRRFAALPPEPVAFLPLQVPVLPPARGDAVSLNYLREVIAQQPTGTRTKLLRRLKDLPRGRRRRHYLLSQPTTTGEVTAFGATVTVARSSPDPIDFGSRKAVVSAWGVSHHYREFQSVRGGALADLARRRVLVVGCGSLGGEVARMLAQAGVGHLHLVDPETLTMENLYRHVLSASDLDVPKAKALASHLRRRVPYLDIGYTVASLADCETDVLRRGFDVVCLLTGEPAFERDFVIRHMARDDGPAIISGWIEPLSLGGAVVVSRPGRPGCLECTFTDRYGETELSGVTSFVAKGFVAARSLLGCEGAFTPYTAIDAMQSAAVVARAVQDELARPGSVFYRHWRAAPDLALAERIEPSHWHGAVTRHDEAAVNELLVNPRCGVCGGLSR